jgi:hypothetical protein
MEGKPSIGWKRFSDHWHSLCSDRILLCSFFSQSSYHQTLNGQRARYGNWNVDILDVVKITRIYNSVIGASNHSSNSDLNDDGAVTILDLVICTSHYGQKWP